MTMAMQHYFYYNFSIHQWTVFNDTCCKVEQ